MIQSRLIAFSFFAIASAVACASTYDASLLPLPKLSLSSPPSLGQPQAAAVAGAVAAIFGRPTVGIRIGGGDWNKFVADAGIDVSFKLPILPLPGIRIDAEAWTQTSSFGDVHGNALSVLGMETFLMGYAGIGPSYYFSDTDGDHRSGFAAKLLVGMSLPGSAFVEASAIVGETPIPVFISIGKRF